MPAQQAESLSESTVVPEFLVKKGIKHHVVLPIKLRIILKEGHKNIT